MNVNNYYDILRKDFYAFQVRSFYELNPTAKFLHNWHIEKIAAELEACRRGDTKRLIINVPPRSLKSHCAISFVANVLGHDPSARIISTSYGRELANKHAMDCRALMSTPWYQAVFPRTRLSGPRPALQGFMTTEKGFRLATSVGGVLTGMGGNFIIIDDPLKPDEALSDTQRAAVNNWFDNTLYSRLDDKQNGRIIIIMQRLHEDDLVGHVQRLEPWKVLRFPAIAEEEEEHIIGSPHGTRVVHRHIGEPLHPEREPLEVLNHLRETLGEYNFAGQYQQAPAPLGGGLVKEQWFPRYTNKDLPEQFEMVFQSWDTANKATELSDYSVCTTWGVSRKKLYLLHVLRRRMDYPELKMEVRFQATLYPTKFILIEDKASGTQLIQELIREGLHGVTRYQPKMDKTMRLHSTTSMMENGVISLPEKAEWLAAYIHELTTFPHGKFDDQADSTSQALDWYKQRCAIPSIALFWHEQHIRDLKKQGRYAEARKLEEEGVT